MKKTLIALTLALVIPVAAFANMGGPGPREPGARLERMAETLNLDDAQKARMKALFEQHRATRKAMREQMRTQMAEILNDEQRAKMEQMHSQRREHRKGRRARRQMRDCGEDKSG
jgi:Spy/CpxP family protein refolding chaperone